MSIVTISQVDTAPSRSCLFTRPLETHWQSSEEEIETSSMDSHYSCSSDITGKKSISTTSTIRDNDEVQFKIFLDRWHEERGITSSVSEMTTCRSYLRIIAMGRRALPLILKQLKREGRDPDHWFAALEAIVGHDPIPKDAYGSTTRMAHAWFDWADENSAW